MFWNLNFISLIVLDILKLFQYKGFRPELAIPPGPRKRKSRHYK